MVQSSLYLLHAFVHLPCVSHSEIFFLLYLAFGFPGLPPQIFLLTPFSDTLASSLRLVTLSPAIGDPSLRPGSSAPSPTTPRRMGPSPPTSKAEEVPGNWEWAAEDP
jgi:hypothetical protein